MSTTHPPPDRPPTVVEIAGRGPLGDDAKALLAPGLKPPAYLDRLLQKGLVKDALSFVAAWLPAREAVWWGCLCAWHHGRPKPSDKEAAALRAALRWVHEPSEENRRAAKAAGDAVGGPATPAGALALAAAWSG